MNEEKLPALHIIDETIAQLTAMRDEPDLTPEEVAAIDAQLQEWIGRDVKKLEGCYGYIKHEEQLAGIAKQVGQEAIMWQHRHENRAERVKDMVKLVLEGRQQKRAELPFGGFTVRANGGMRALDIPNEQEIPEQYHKYKFEVSAYNWRRIQRALRALCEDTVERAMLASAKAEIDSAAVRKALESGEEVPGAKLADRGTSLLVR